MYFKSRILVLQSFFGQAAAYQPDINQPRRHLSPQSLNVLTIVSVTEALLLLVHVCDVWNGIPSSLRQDI